MKKLLVFCFVVFSSNLLCVPEDPETKINHDIQNQENITIDDNTENAVPAPEQVSCLKKYSKYCSSAIDPKILCKSLIYRIFAACGSAGVAYFITGNPKQSLQIAGVNSAVATVLYYTYDRIWNYGGKTLIPLCKRKCKRS